MIWVDAAHLWVAFAATLFLVFFHYLSPWLTSHLPDEGRAFESFSGGVAVSYVFLEMLPELVEYNKPIGEFLLTHQSLTPFTELFIYIFSLLGFTAYYGFELLAESRRNQGKSRALVYRLHLSTFYVYNFLITYTMSLRANDSLLATVLFTLAMAFHFLLTDRKFSRLYSVEFNRTGRFILISALALGWVVSVLFDPVNVLISALMVSFLAGSVLLSVFREEIPEVNRGSYSWFVGGALLIALVLLLQTWLVSLNYSL